LLDAGAGIARRLALPPGQALPRTATGSTAGTTAGSAAGSTAGTTGSSTAGSMAGWAWLRRHTRPTKIISSFSTWGVIRHQADGSPR
jgi:hypothetical protein